MPPKRKISIKNSTIGEPPTKKDNSSQTTHAQPGISCEATCQAYNTSHTFTLVCSIDALKDKAFTEGILIGNHLKWKLSAAFEQRNDGADDKKTLGMCVWHWDAVKYPMEYEIEYEVKARDANDSVSKTLKRTYDHPRFAYIRSHMLTYDELIGQRDKFEVDGKITLTAKINVSMPLCCNFVGESVFWDVKIRVGNVSFPFIKTNLAAHSSFFNTMFFGPFKEANQDEVILKDVDISSFVTLINVIFVRTFQLKVTSISSVLELADRFGMLRIVEYCKKKLLKCGPYSEISLAERLVIADKYSIDDLQKRCLKLCDSPKTIKKVMESDHYKDLPAEVKAQLLERMVEVMPKNVLR